MTSPPDLDTPFRRLASKLPSPLAERFDTTCWEAAIAACNPTEDDRRLLHGALWVGAKAQALYATRPVRFPGLGPTDALTLAIAVLNHQYRIILANARTAGEKASKDGPVCIDYISNIRFENALGQNMSSGDYVEAFIDALDAWLYDAKRSLAVSEPPPTNIGEMVEPLVHFYSMRHILKRLFDKILHLGHHADKDGIWVPHNQSLASLHQAWFARGQAVFDGASAQLLTAWSDLDSEARWRWGLVRSVTEARYGRYGLCLKVRRLRYLSKRAPAQALTRIGLRHSYLAEFLGQPLPLAPDLTAALIEDAWWICRDAAKSLETLTLRISRTRVTSAQHANAIDRPILVEAIGIALAVEIDVADALVTFLTHGEAPSRGRGKTAHDSDHGWRGLWTAPLVKVPDKDVLLLPRAVFEQCAPLYRVEAWLEKGGISDRGVTLSMRGKGQRGNQFERSYRDQLCAALMENPLLRTSRIAVDEIRKEEIEGGFPEQIDIVFKLGNRLFVGELKFLLTPADPHQWSRHYEKLADAARQAHNKAAALAARPDIAAAALSVSEAEVTGLSVTPLVILNNGFGFSLEVNGCRVIDAMYLRDFIRSPEFATGGAIKGRKLFSEEVMIVYENEQDAARRFDEIMARPAVLTRFLHRVGWDIVDYPSDDGIPLRIASPFRGDMTPWERERRQALLPEQLHNFFARSR